MKLVNLPNEILLEIILKIDNIEDLSSLIKSSKKAYNLSKIEVVSEHIIKNLIIIEKPSVFRTYKGFLYHYTTTVKNTRLNKPEIILFYKNFNNYFHFESITPNSIEKFESKFGRINLR
jgi:hypothetical protein